MAAVIVLSLLAAGSAFYLFYHFREGPGGGQTGEEAREETAKTSETVQTNMAKSAYAPRFDRLAEMRGNLKNLSKTEKELTYSVWRNGQKIDEYVQLDSGSKTGLNFERFREDAEKKLKEDDDSLKSVQKEIEELNQQLAEERRSLLDEGLSPEEIDNGTKEAEVNYNLRKNFGGGLSDSDIAAASDEELISRLAALDNQAATAENVRKETTTLLISGEESYVDSGKKINRGPLHEETGSRMVGGGDVGKDGKVENIFDGGREFPSSANANADFYRSRRKPVSDDWEKALERRDAALSGMGKLKQELESRGLTSEEIAQRVEEKRVAEGLGKYEPPDASRLIGEDGTINPAEAPPFIEENVINPYIEFLLRMAEYPGPIIPEMREQIKEQIPSYTLPDFMRKLTEGEQSYVAGEMTKDMFGKPKQTPTKFAQGDNITIPDAPSGPSDSP